MRNSERRGRKILEKHKHPRDRYSRKFFSEEKYHYSQNLQIEAELKQFKKVKIKIGNNLLTSTIGNRTKI